MPHGYFGEQNLPKAVFMGLICIYCVYELLAMLRTGVGRGRGGFTYTRESDPGTYWFGVVVISAFCLYFLFSTIRSL